ncbi:hypothetical protein EDB84DRAFT_1480990 [Lactarius hengduanensis]|nr:hypothetical protein EDB84DRAFT_1532988 [Lactarius hengduanensis]KAH9037568.1 hypothetical protein EDB84DRAFT_1480990 [Lactarius hengduanensis]
MRVICEYLGLFEHGFYAYCLSIAVRASGAHIVVLDTIYRYFVRIYMSFVLGSLPIASLYDLVFL